MLDILIAAVFGAIQLIFMIIFDLIWDGVTAIIDRIRGREHVKRRHVRKVR